MSMKKILNPVYRQDYFEGYSNGSNPLIKINQTFDNEAFVSGFNAGRLDYESMNGRVICGIPEQIVTNKVLEEFLLAGLLGLSVNTEGYTAFQLNIIAEWYQSGTEKYDPDESIYLLAILEKNGIEVS